MNYREKFLKNINKIVEKEIDKVNINQYYLEVLESQDKEIERLNNIINELEKIISLDFNYVNNDLSDNFVFGIRNEAKAIYRELQELKGSDK